MRRSRVLWVGSILLIVGATIALAQPDNRGPGPRDPGMMFERLAERLELTDEQREELQAVLEVHRDARMEHKEKVAAAHAALEAEIGATEFDEAAIRAAASVLAAVQADGYVGRAAMLQQVRQILSAEQFEEFQLFHARQQQREQGGRRHGRARGPRGGR